MKIRRLLTATGIGVIAAAGIVTGVVYASSNNQVVQGTTDKSVYRAADTVTITGTVNGDIFCAGQAITIDATVNGDVLCAGQNVSINGTVNGNVRLAGQIVTLGAKVMHSASVAGQSVTIENSATIGRDLSVTAQTATIDGNVERDINAAADTATLGNAVGRNVTFYANSLTLGNGTSIAGDVTYTSPQKLQKNGSAQVLGTTTYHQGQKHHASITYEPIWLKLYWAVAMIILSVVLVAVFPQAFRRWNPTRGVSFWRALLAGFIGMFAVPVVIAILALTVVGIPLAALVLLLWIAAALVSVPLASYFTGSLVVPKRHPVIMVLVGSLILSILWFIPLLGWFVGLVAYWVGAGILLIGLRQHYPAPVYRAEE